MALLSATPQVPALSGQFSNIWSGLRHLTAGHGRLSGKVTSERDSGRSQIASTEKGSELTCASLLNHIEFDPVTLSVLSPRQRPALKSHWRQSHKSEDSFHQNIHGVNLSFDVKVQEVCRAVLGSNHIFSSKVHDVMHQQIRGFKTLRSETTGISGARKLGRIEPVKVPANEASFDSGMFRQEGVSYKVGATKLMSSTDLSAEEEAKLKISFADGFHAGADWKNLVPGLNSTEGNQLRTQAFFEGYKSHAAATMPRHASKAGVMAKFGAFMLRVVLLSCVTALFWLFLSPNISIKKVSFLNGDQFEVNPETVTVTFDDVRGSAEAKAELANIVDFLKNPDKYTDLGAKLPNGCLLVGPPGVGKTLLAKAVAGEAGVPFFQASGAEFDEVYVGTGAKRVRQLFQAAKMKAPCVIFIDEIDSVGSKRTSSEMHPYANQTVNQLLTEMDGFEANEGVIVLGATNKKSNLDKALLRPGRFDVEVSIRVPDLNERKEILQLYLPKIITDGSVDVLIIAKQTTGCTGADLNNIVNHAAMKAATDGYSAVAMHHVEYAIDKVRMGPQKKRILSPQVNSCTAYHEAGHAIIQYFSKVNSSKLHKITILPRGQSLGMTHFIHDEKREFQYTKEEMLDDLDALMGGRIAEEMIFGEDKVSTGASSDMQRATQIATNMVQTYGFSEKVGLRCHYSKDETVSERVKDAMDEEINRLLKESYDRAKHLLTSKKKQMCLLAEALLEFEELSYNEAKIIIEGGKLNRNAPSSGTPPSKGGPSGKGSGNSKHAEINHSPIKPVKL